MAGDRPTRFLEVELAPKRIERLFVEEVPGRGWRVASIPFGAELSFGDVVWASDRDGKLLFERIVELGGHSTIRLTLSEPQSEASFRELWAPFAALGLSCEATSSGRLALDVPPEADRGAVDKLLAQGERDGVWTSTRSA